MFSPRYLLTYRLTWATFFVVSLTLASPLPVHVIKEARGIAVEPNAREFSVDYEILHREASAFAELGGDLPKGACTCSSSPRVPVRSDDGYSG